MEENKNVPVGEQVSSKLNGNVKINFYVSQVSEIEPQLEQIYLLKEKYPNANFVVNIEVSNEMSLGGTKTTQVEVIHKRQNWEPMGNYC